MGARRVSSRILHACHHDAAKRFQHIQRTLRDPVLKVVCLGTMEHGQEVDGPQVSEAQQQEVAQRHLVKQRVARLHHLQRGRGTRARSDGRADSKANTKPGNQACSSDRWSVRSVTACQLSHRLLAGTDAALGLAHMACSTHLAKVIMQHLISCSCQQPSPTREKPTAPSTHLLNPDHAPMRANHERHAMHTVSRCRCQRPAPSRLAPGGAQGAPGTWHACVGR